MDLSERRAQSAVNYLINNGDVPRRNIVARGYGETKLVNGCNNSADCTEKQHALNRRSELKIIGTLASEGAQKSLAELKEQEQMDQLLQELMNQEQIKVSDGESLEDAIGAKPDKPVIDEDVKEKEVVSEEIELEDFDPKKIKADQRAAKKAKEAEEKRLKEEMEQREEMKRLEAERKQEELEKQEEMKRLEAERKQEEMENAAKEKAEKEAMEAEKEAARVVALKEAKVKAEQDKLEAMERQAELEAEKKRTEEIEAEKIAAEKMKMEAEAKESLTKATEVEQEKTVEMSEAKETMGADKTTVMDGVKEVAEVVDEKAGEEVTEKTAALEPSDYDMPGGVHAIVVHFTYQPLPKEHSIFKKHENVEVFKGVNKELLYTIGAFKKREEADKFLKSYLQDEYPNAYIIGLKEGKRYY